MAHNLQTLPRKIVFKGRTLADLNPDASVADVLKMHAAQEPSLATAYAEGPEVKDGHRVYEVKERLGSKG